MSTDTASHTIFTTATTTLRSRWAASQQRRQRRWDSATINNSSARSELDAIVNRYPSEVLDESKRR